MSRLDLPYFSADDAELSGEPGTCPYCGTEGTRLDTGRLAEPAGSGMVYGGCLPCLRAGRFVVVHDAAAERVTQAQQAELARTPRFRTWQTPRWLDHCDDFMRYIGAWARAEFLDAARAAGCAPAELFGQLQTEWPGEEFDTLWGEGVRGTTTFYAFECVHCATRSGFLDDA